MTQQTIIIENNTVEIIEVGTQGPAGATGPAGAGIATGGTTGQVLAKASDTDYDTTWETVSGTGTVTAVSVTPSDGVTASITNPNTTPALAVGLGDITPHSVAATSTVTGSNLSGTNTGDVTLSGQNYISLTGQALTASAVNLAGSNVTGTLPVTRGGTGNTSYTDGQLLIGNSSTGGLSKAALTAGSNVTITNANGSITIASTGGGGGGSGTVTDVTFTGDGTVLDSTPSTAVTTSGTLTATLLAQAKNTILAGPTTGSNAAPTFRALGGADLPNPSSSSLGGVQSIVSASHKWIDSISTSGVPHLSQPAASDISGLGTAATENLATVIVDDGSGNLTIGSGVVTNAMLVNNSTTVNGTAIALGASGTVKASTTNALTVSTGLQLESGSTFDGSSAHTLSVDSTVATLTGAQTLTNKTINASSNTLSNIATSMFASGVVDTDGTLSANSDTRLASQKAVKSYVDTLSAGLSPKTSCRVATTAALTATYSNGSSGVGATLTNSSTQAAISIDGVSLSASDRVLVKDQSTQTQNGIYTVTTVGSGSTNWVLTRATDYDNSPVGEVAEGTYSIISEGTVNAANMYVETGAGPFTIGTTNIIFSSFNSAANITAGTGLSKSGNTLSIDSTVATLSGSQTLTNKTISGSSNTLSNIGNSSLTNSSITINGSGVSLGGSTTISTITGNAGTATALQTTRAIYGNNFDGTTALTQIIASTYGGTGNGFAKFSGPASSEKTFTLPNSNATILTDNAAVTVAQGGTGAASLTGVLKGNGTSAFTAAAAGTDYCAATSGSSVLKASSGNTTAATAGTDYVAPGTNTTFTASQRCSFSTLTDGATIAPDFGASNNYRVTLGGSRTLALPTNVVAGQTGVISVWQDGTGSRTLSYAWPYQFVGGTAPTLSTGKYSFDQLYYCVNSYATAAVTVTIATPAVMTWTGHGLISGQRIQLATTGALPTGLATGTTYWVNVIDANTFNLSSSLANLQAGTYIATSGSQSGTHTATNASITIASNLGLA